MAEKRKKSPRGAPNPLHSTALILLGGGLVILAVVAWVLLPKGEAAKDDPVASPSSSNRYASVVPVAVDFAAPPLTLQDLHGRIVSLQDHLGSVVLLNNWAIWCPPCKAEMPVLQAYYEAHRHQTFVLVGVEAGDPPMEVATFVSQYGITFPIWVDMDQQAMIAFGNGSLPSSYVIDENGQVRLAWTGAISLEMLERYVTPLLED